MWKKFARNVKPLFASVSIVSGGFVAYYAALAYYNQKAFLDQKINDEQYKDMTRETNEYFGLSWGYKADFLVKEQIDAGDIFFIKYECDECLTLGQMIWCNVSQAYKQEQEYDSIGFAYRDSTGLYVISNQFGVTKIMEYADFLSQPFLSEFSMRKLAIKQQKPGQTKQLFKRLKQHYEFLQQRGDFKEGEVDFAVNFVNALDISDNTEKGQIRTTPPFISEYDSIRPTFFKPMFSLDNKLVIRSGTNKQLNSSNLITSTSSSSLSK